MPFYASTMSLAGLLLIEYVFSTRFRKRTFHTSCFMFLRPANAILCKHNVACRAFANRVCFFYSIPQTNISHFVFHVLAPCKCHSMQAQCRLQGFCYKKRSSLNASFLGKYNNKYYFQLLLYYLIKSLITSPAIIRPATDGTKALLPGVCFL